MIRYKRLTYCYAADAENRACYAAVPLYVVGFVLQGAAFHKHLSVAVYEDPLYSVGALVVPASEFDGG